MSGAAPLPRLRDPLELEALQVRKELAIAHVDELPLERRPALLALVAWPPPELLEWSLERARAKLEHRLQG